jgi:molecular chaperone DnaK (HSP70)
MADIYGLDFGTSNSSIAIANGSAVTVLPIDPTAASGRRSKTP